MGGMQAVAEAWRNLVAVGARPLAITNCLNFGNPERPPVMGQLVGCIEGMAAACRALDFPVVSGNVSLYNETDGNAILPTPNVGGLGLIEDLARMVGIGLADEPGLDAGAAGRVPGLARQLALLAARWSAATTAPRRRSISAAERRTGEFVLGQIAAGRVRACHDLADGGLRRGRWPRCAWPAASVPRSTCRPTSPSVAGWWFGEDQGRYLLAVPSADDAPSCWRRGRAAGVLARVVGRTGGDALIVGDAAPHIDGRAAVDARGMAAGLHGGRGGPEQEPFGPCR